MLPASYLLLQGSITVGKIRRCGGFADVSEGEYLGRRVAIKHLRFGTEDAFNKIFKVVKLQLTQLFIVAQLARSDFAVRLSGGSACLTQTSCHCWGSLSPRIPIISVSSPTGCEMGT